MTEAIVYEKRDRIALIRMNRPEALNARNSQMRAELPQVLTPEVPADPAMHRQALIDLAVFDGIDLRERR